MQRQSWHGTAGGGNVAWRYTARPSRSGAIGHGNGHGKARGWWRGFFASRAYAVWVGYAFGIGVMVIVRLLGV